MEALVLVPASPAAAANRNRAAPSTTTRDGPAPNCLAGASATIAASDATLRAEEEAAGAGPVQEQRRAAEAFVQSKAEKKKLADGATHNRPQYAAALVRHADGAAPALGMPVGPFGALLPTPREVRAYLASAASRPSH